MSTRFKSDVAVVARARGALAACLLLLAFTASAAERRIEVAFFAGSSAQSEFWVDVGKFATAVAHDLDIDLHIVYPGETTFEQEGSALLETLGNDAYLITAYVDPVIGRLLQAADARGIRTILINTDVIERDRASIGEPRQKLRHWIGQMQPNDLQAGYEIADLLLTAIDGPVNMIAINGNNNVRADAERRAGLKQRLSSGEDAVLHAMKEGQWSEAKARSIALELLQQHPNANAIWTASDSMALGAIEAVRRIGKKPGKDIVIAGVDWTSRGLDAIRTGEMLASAGGHFTEAGLALLLIYDHYHGKDFADDVGVSFRTPMRALSTRDIDRYFDKNGRTPDWSRVDFKRLTKTGNPDLKRYDFSWESIVEQL